MRMNPANRSALLVGLGLLTACATAGTTPPTGEGGGGDDILVGSGGSGGEGLHNTCGAIEETAEQAPLELYVALDKSAGMAGTKWNGARAGLAAFAADPQSAGTSVALNFFPLDGSPTCDHLAYKVPVVPFGELPAHGPALVAAIDATTPNGFHTPLYPALGGAILAALDVAKQKPGHAAAVLLVTDGLPLGPATTCAGKDPEDPAVLAELAALGVASKPSILTFVIGLPGVDQAVANQIAAAGGTDSVILVGASDVEGQFRDALVKARGKALPCEYALPEDVEVGFINVHITTGAGEELVLVYDPSCASGGWHYDSPASPTKIVLCPSTCAEVKKDLAASVKILLGCKTEIPK